ncbi:hypothetical protein M513_00276 [Trichuris suis]|uniref:adenylate kinase n=1 Tax=Trichuris suis TaxID=68888 RepID=A0A085MPG7_9BILA|nr:hypothetical protein M513_00276 [Trichuris suis]
MSDEEVSRLLQSLRRQAERELLLELLDMVVEEDLIPTMGQWDGGVDSSCLFDDDAHFNDLEVKVVRDEHTGEVTGYREAIEETPDTASSVLSLNREINTDNVQFTGMSGGIPFMPGGMEEDIAQSQKNPEDFSVDISPEEYHGAKSVCSDSNCFNTFVVEEEPVDSNIDSMNIKDTLLSVAPSGIFPILDELGLSSSFDWLSVDEKPSGSSVEAKSTQLADSSAGHLDENKLNNAEDSSLLDVENIEIVEKKAVIEENDASLPKSFKGDYEWARSVEMTDSVPEFEKLRPTLAKTYPFELDWFQKEAIVHLERGDSVFVAAHTSAGKTVVAEYAIALCQRHNTRAVYTSPVKALSNQKFRDFKNMFTDVGLVTGDVQLNTDAFCLIMTTEILRSMLYNGSEVVRELEWVIFDEVHYVNDPERGVVWEEVLIMLPNHVRVIMLSATVDDILEFADWIGRIKRRHIYVLKTLQRPVPLEHFLYTGKDGRSKRDCIALVNRHGTFLNQNYIAAEKLCSSSMCHMSTKNRYRIRENFGTTKNRWMTLISYLEEKDLLPMVAFVFSRVSCDRNASMLMSMDLTSNAEKSKVHRFFEHCFARLSPSDRNAPQILTIQEMCKRGIAVHHSGVLPIMKEAVEILFQQGLVRILFATETFAMGVNMPARTVVFDSVEKHDGHSVRLLHPGEYTQMAGRAGRRSLDKTGTVIILCKGFVPAKNDLMHMILGKPPKIQSRFRLTYNMLLNLFRAQPITPEMMIGKSYVENVSFRSYNSLLDSMARLKKRLDLMPELTCKRCKKGKIDAYFDVAKSLFDQCSAVLHDTLPSIRTGNILVVQTDSCFRVALVLNCYKFRGATYFQALMPYIRLSNSFLDNLTDVESWRMLHYGGVAKLFPVISLKTYSIVDVSEKSIVFVASSSVRINLNSRAIMEDWRLIKSKNCPPSNDVQQLLLHISAISPMVFQEFDSALSPVSSGFAVSEQTREMISSASMLQYKLRTFSCTSCQHFTKHFRLYYSRRALEQQATNCEEEMNRQELRLLPEYQNRLRVLRHFKYIDDSCIVQLPGKVAAVINQHPLLFSQLLLDNAVGPLRPDELASLLSATSCQHKRTSVDIPMSAEVKKLIEKLNATQEAIRKVERECEIAEADVESELNFNLMHVVQSWAKGMPFCELMTLTDAQEGIVVRCIQRVHEACRDLKTASCLIGDPNLTKLVDETLLAIRRDIVFTTSFARIVIVRLYRRFNKNQLQPIWENATLWHHDNDGDQLVIQRCAMASSSAQSDKARQYLVEKNVPVIFESLMIGLVSRRPDDVIQFMLDGLRTIRTLSVEELKWDMFIDNPPLSFDDHPKDAVSTIEKVDAAGGVPVGESELNTVEQMVGDVNKPKQVNENDQAAPDTDTEPSVLASSQPDIQQTPLDVPVVILLGCIGSQKTKLAKYAAQKLHEKGLTALHTSDLVKGALKDLEHVDLEALYEASGAFIGRLVSDDVINRIVYQAVSDVSDKSDLVLINGYPLTMEQLNYMKPVGTYHSLIGHIRRLLFQLFNVKAVALIDYHLKDLEKQFEERQMNSAESKNRIDEFVSKTMPVIPGECGSEAIEESIVLLLRGLLDPESVKEADKVNVESSQLEEVKATEQKEELREAPVDNGLVCFEAPVVLIVGAPGSFKSKYCAWLTDHFDGIAHVSMGQLIADAIEANPGNSLYEKASEDMKAGEFISKKLCFELISQAVDRLAGKEYLFLLIEGYPRDLEEMSDLSTLVKDIKMVILIDCTEKFCEANVRRKMNGLRSSDEIDVYVSRCIQSFKVNTLPMLKYFDERKLLRLLEGDKGVEDLLPEILNTLETTFGCLNGGPGSGKGTQCAKIVQKYKLTHLSSGDLLRADVESGSQRGKQIKEIMANGQLVALEIVLDLIKEAMLKALTQGSKGFLIDGFPRDVTQGEKFEAEILPCAHVLFFDVSEDTMIKRLIGRGASSGRVDDNMETIKKRLETFRKQTQPVVDYYREKKKLAQVIKAEGTVDEIFAEVDKVMQKHVKLRTCKSQRVTVLVKCCSSPAMNRRRNLRRKRSSESDEDAEEQRRKHVETIRQFQLLRKRTHGLNVSELMQKGDEPKEKELDCLRLKTGGMVDMKKLKSSDLYDAFALRLSDLPPFVGNAWTSKRGFEVHFPGKANCATKTRRSYCPFRRKFVEEELCKRKGMRQPKEEETPKPRSIEERLFELPEHLKKYQSKTREDMLSNQMLCGIPEVDLGIEWASASRYFSFSVRLCLCREKIKTIEETEAAKQRWLTERANKGTTATTDEVEQADTFETNYTMARLSCKVASVAASNKEVFEKSALPTIPDDKPTDAECLRKFKGQFLYQNYQ